MKTPAGILSVAAAVIITLFISGYWMAPAAESDSPAIGSGTLVPQTAPAHYQSIMEKLQRQWRIDPAVAEAHNLSTTGWETPACAPRGAEQPRTVVGNGLDRTEKCVQGCMRRTSLDNPNGILLCRSSCL